jgi:lipopolysaccharide transport system ATP-binding protein
MSSKTTIRGSVSLKNISKFYRVNELRHRQTLYESIGRFFNPASHNKEALASDLPNSSPNFIWALKNISFEVGPGQVLGLIGKNGSGKSTLLKIISKITKPTQGSIAIEGRVGALLEVGTGFHPDLSGRDNIFLNASIIGMKREEIRSRLDSIIEFSEVENFIDTPVKHYSSGMFMRLAFSVASHLDTEIMLIDEVLAVGDTGFQKKCKDKIRSIAQSGKTIIFTSHDMVAISELCTQCIVINNGESIFFGDTQDSIDNYNRIIEAS